MLYVVPSSMREEVLRSCHDSISAGHQGYHCTLDLLRRSFYWFGYRTDVQKYVPTCLTCLQVKHPRRKPRAKVDTYQAGVPMEWVHIDILGPFPPNKSGNVYILMMIDQFTRWVESMPLKDETVEVMARSAVDNFFSRFGLPSELHSDQGRNFMSNLFVELCERLQIARTRTTPYHPSGNGQVERKNRLLLQLIRAYLGKQQNTWDESLPLLASVVRSAVNRSMGFSANMLMLGQELPLPVEVLFGMSEVNMKSQMASSYVTQLCEKLNIVMSWLGNI